MIDYLVGSALAITSMLALLLFGTDIIRLNVEARERWQAKMALADFDARWHLSGESLPIGPICRGGDSPWIVAWCISPPVMSLPHARAEVDINAPAITLRWGQGGAAEPDAQSVRRGL